MKESEKENSEASGMLRKEETLKLAEAKVAYLGQQIRVLAPFIKRLEELQARKFTLPEGGAMTVDLGAPDADNNRFPLNLQYNGKSWSTWWNYADRNSAKDFYRTRTYLKAEGLFQIEEAAQLSPKLTSARVTHPGTKEARDFGLEMPRIFIEIDQFGRFQQEEATALNQSAKFRQEQATAKAAREKEAKLLARKEIGRDGRFIAYNDGTVVDKESGLMWAAKDNGSAIRWKDAKSYCENYRVSEYTDWRMPTKDELAGLYDKSKKNRHGCKVTDLIEITRCYVWASEIRGYDAAFFDFEDGVRNWYPKLKLLTPVLQALPVRSGK